MATWSLGGVQQPSIMEESDKKTGNTGAFTTGKAFSIDICMKLVPPFND
jgi:hypothetical protein